MARRVVFGLILFAMVFYDSISLLVDEWEGRLCWDLGSPEYVRLPFASALRGAWDHLLKQMNSDPAVSFLVVPMQAAFLLPALAVSIAPRRLVTITAFLAIALPFALTIYEKITLGLDPWCDGHGGEAIGAAAIEFLFVLPLGLIVLLAAIFAPRSAPAAV